MYGRREIFRSGGIKSEEKVWGWASFALKILGTRLEDFEVGPGEGNLFDLQLKGDEIRFNLNASAIKAEIW
jgi:hypothetical protein